MREIKLKETDYNDAFKSASYKQSMGGDSYKAFLGTSDNGADITVLIGREPLVSKELKWHMSISCKEALNDDAIRQIVKKCWPSDVRYGMMKSDSFGLHYTHFYEANAAGDGAEN